MKKMKWEKMQNNKGGVPTKLLISHLLIDLEYLAWHQINA